jgi:formylglycine-generating enzyme required for sulfatase activity
VDFYEKLQQYVSSCDVLIVLIGQEWLTVKDERGNYRLDDPKDFVRLEVSAALKRDIRVIPILVHDGRMPDSDELPDDLQSLARLNAFEIRHERFNADVDRLIRSVEEYLLGVAEKSKQESAELAAQEQAKISDHIAKAVASMEREDWDTASRHYRDVLILQPEHLAAQVGLRTALESMELAQLYEQALLYQDANQLEEAARVLQRILEKDAAYRNVPELISEINMRLGEQAFQAPEEERSPPDSERSRFGFLNAVPRGLLYLGAGIGLVLILALACWGGNTFMASMRETETPTPVATPTLIEILYFTDTPSPVVATATQLPTDTLTPPPTDTSTLESAITPSHTPTIGLPEQIVDNFGVPMVLVPAGSFEMGGKDNEEYEKPIHTVPLDDFYIDQYEVTNARYAKCVDEGVCVPPANTKLRSTDNYYANDQYLDFPVINVNWHNAKTYCEWRNARLPTEAEWEKAARGGLEGRRYSWGDSFKENLANFCDMNCPFSWKDERVNDNYAETAPVGSYTPNGYDLYDMAGNVWEWTDDWFYVYPGGDPKASDEFGTTHRVMRGGAWDGNKRYLFVAYRKSVLPYNTNFSYGIRCARDP